MIYVNYDENTREIKAYYDDEINEFIPEPKFSITQEEHLKALNINANYVTNELRLIYKEKELSIDELKARAKTIIEQKRDKLAYKDVVFKDKLYQADAKSQATLTQTIVLYTALGDVPQGFVWRASDDTNTPFSLAELVALGGAMGEQYQKAYQFSWEQKTKLESLATSDEIKTLIAELESL